MPTPLQASMPDDLVIGDGFIMRWTAIDPTTGALVTGVTVSNVNVDADDLSTGIGAASQEGSGPVIGPYMLVPGPGA